MRLLVKANNKLISIIHGVVRVEMDNYPNFKMLRIYKRGEYWHSQTIFVEGNVSVVGEGVNV